MGSLGRGVSPRLCLLVRINCCYLEYLLKDVWSEKISSNPSVIMGSTLESIDGKGCLVWKPQEMGGNLRK